MKIIAGNIAVLENDTHYSKWVEKSGRLDTDSVIGRICEFLKPGDVAVDAGAMIGGYSHAFKRAVGASGRVLAFEPNPEAFACLEHNCPEIEAHNCALSDKEQDLHLRVDGQNAGASHIAEDGITVCAVRLDDVAKGFYGFDRCALIKIDVEGMEPRVLDGARNVIQTMRPIIFIEINDGALLRHGFRSNDIIKRLCVRHDYDIAFLEPHHNLDMPQVDVFFLPP